MFWRIRAAIWLNDTENGPRYNVQISRLYKDQNEKWKDSTSFFSIGRWVSTAPRRPLWLGVHRDVRALPRVRATIAFLVAAFERVRAELAPEGTSSQS